MPFSCYYHFLFYVVLVLMLLHIVYNNIYQYIYAVINHCVCNSLLFTFLMLINTSYNCYTGMFVC